MIADIAIGGVFIPGLLVLGLLAAACTFAVMRLAALTGLDRAIARKPLVELACFIILFCLLVQFQPLTGFLP